jgi:nitrogen regulatory protein PII
MSLLDFELLNVPIEFKQINPDDFDSQYYEVNPKHIITPNEAGYISNQIIDLIKESYDEKNTVVINAGVGQGKSYSVIEMIKGYASIDEYVIILAVPYNSLIKQYVEDITKETSTENISESKVFSMLDIESLNFAESSENNELMNYGYVNDSEIIRQFKVSNYKVHIMSINSLLSNSGENILFQAGKKTKYFNQLNTYCFENKKKVIVFFDEIHDGIHNFKEEYLYSFWKYQGLVHKIFVVSATFNEASKEVIKYLSEFTDHKIQLIESERKIFLEKQSRLHLVMHSGGAYSNNPNLSKILKYLVDTQADFDVVVYSKQQIKKIFQQDSEVLKILSEHKKTINFCYADVFDGVKANKNYDSSHCNIGTNFTTGVNISQENHTLIIFIPIRLDLEFINNRGVFSSCPNSIIQALARQRKVGDIYIIMPPPLGINADSLPYDETINESIVNIFKNYKEFSSDEVEYTDINKQSILLEKTYKKLKTLLNKAEANITSIERQGMNRLIYPTKEIFVMEKGEKHLTDNFFGGDLSTYVFWASITNQFQNCRLTSIIRKEDIYFETETLYEDLVREYERTLSALLSTEEEVVNEDYFFPFKLYSDMEESIIGRNKLVYIDGKVATKKQQDTIKLYLLDIINFKDFTLSSEKEIKERVYLYYLRSCIKYSMELDINIDYFVDLEIGIYQMESVLGEVIFLFKEWNPFINLIKSQVKVRTRGMVFSTNPNEAFINLFNEKGMIDKLNKLMLTDKFLSTDIFPFRDTLSRIKEDEKIIKFFYKLLVNISFNFDSNYYPKVYGERHYSVLQINNLSDCSLNNLLYDSIPEVIL